MLDILQPGDIIIFDSITRFARNADEGFKLYKDLMKRNINLIFLKEPYINTSTYKIGFKGIESNVTILNSVINNFLQNIIDLLNKFIIDLLEAQIKQAFELAEKEAKDIQINTREGLKVAKLEGKQIGQVKGTKLTTKKSIKAKEIIKEYHKEFDGIYDDKTVRKMAKISINTFYKYKKELKQLV